MNVVKKLKILEKEQYKINLLLQNAKAEEYVFLINQQKKIISMYLQLCAQTNMDG